MRISKKVTCMLIIALIFLSIMIIMIACTLPVTQKEEPRNLARAVAQHHLQSLSNIPEYSNLFVSKSRPLYDIDGNKASIFDVKVISQNGEDRGYILVNLDREDFPILEFTFEGMSLTEHFERMIPGKEFHVVWLTPTYCVAVDTEGRVVKKIGDYVRDGSQLKLAPLEKMSESKFHKFISEEWIKYRKSKKNAISRAWKQLLGGANELKTSDLVVDNPGIPTTWRDDAEGIDRAPHLDQIPPQTGENGRNFYSGCGADAWAELIVWHDLLWTPELLHGSQNDNGSDWGLVPIIPNSEPAWNCYIDRVIMGLSRELETSNDDGTGWVSFGDMEKGFDYIINTLGFIFTGKAQGSGGNVTQKVYNRIVLDNRPVIVHTPSHYSVAGGFLYNSSDTSVDAHWLYISHGGGFKYISTAHLTRFWYFKKIEPNLQREYQLQAADTPVLLSMPSNYSPPDILLVFWLGSDMDIHYVSTAPEGWPDFNMSKNLGVQALYSPAVCGEGDHIYLAYVDMQNRIHVMMYSRKSRTWTDLEFPSSIRTDVKPAICGGTEDWLTVAFSNDEGVQITSTNRDCEGTRPLWQGNSMDPDKPDRYWHQVDFNGSSDDVSMIRFRDDTYLPYKRQNGDYYLYCANANGTKREFKEFHGSNWISGTPSLVVSNDLLFMAYRDAYYRIVVDRVRTWHRTSIPSMNDQYEGQTWVISNEEAAWLMESCIDDPSLSVIWREQGKYPSLVLGYMSGENTFILRWLSIDNSFRPINYTNKP